VEEVIGNVHSAIDELRQVVERAIAPAVRFARLIDEAAAAAGAGDPLMHDAAGEPGSPASPELAEASRVREVLRGLVSGLSEREIERWLAPSGARAAEP
jgi:hypothetical protein